MSQSNSQTGFLDLSPELRNRIYHLVLTCADKAHREVDIISTYEVKHPSIDLIQKHILPDVPIPRRGLRPNLLATCKRVHEEATPIPYGNLVFHTSRRTLRDMVVRDSIQLQFIRHCILDVYVYEDPTLQQAQEDSMDLGRALMDLEKMKVLETVELAHCIVREETYVTSAVGLAKKLVRVVRRMLRVRNAEEEEQGTANLADVVSLDTRVAFEETDVERYCAPVAEFWREEAQRGFDWEVTEALKHMLEEAPRRLKRGPH